MVTIIDRTLTTLNSDQIQSQDLNHFCTLLFTCGVTKIELPLELVTLMKARPLAVDTDKWSNRKTGFLTQANDDFNNGIWKLEPNDLVEEYIPISKIETIQDENIRLMGLEDLITQDYPSVFQKLLNNDAHTLDLCPSNIKHCATAIALEWVLAGGTSISCGFADNHDFPPLEEVLMGLKLISDPSSFKGDLSVLSELRVLYEKITLVPISKMKAIIGADIFKVESGIHVDGVLKNPTTYEPFNPQIVGNQREIVLGKHSGPKSVLYKLREQNLSESGSNSILTQIKERCSHLGRSISDLELLTLASEVQNDYAKKIYC